MVNYLLSNTKSLYVILGFLMSLLFFPSSGQAQDDNPNLDHIPKWYLEQTQNQNKQPSQVITIDDYDNYYLGVDFAEGHITVNPNVPTEFFTVFNIDNAHRTGDGHDWFNSNVSWGTNPNGDVIVAYDSIGNLYYENMYGGISGCKVATSQNNGQSWGSAVTAISGVDKNWMAADQTGGPYSNYVYTVMTSNSGGNFARSTNQGSSWNNTSTFASQSLPGMMVCVGPNGNVQGGSVYVVTNGGSSFGSNYTFYRSTNGGTSFQQMSSQYFSGYVGVNSSGRHSVENMRTRPYPFIGADNSYGPNRGRLYLIYASNDPPGNGNKPDIWCRYSDNGGSSWSSAIKVNDDENTENNHQFEPAMWCDYTTGKLYVQWMDTRDTPTHDSALIYGTYSDDGGESFKPNVAISNKKMRINCTTCGGGGTPRYQGDYNGIVSNPKVAMACWSDFRNGNFASYVGYIPDFAFRVYPSIKEITYMDTLWAVVPDVKLYSDTVEFFATIEDPPGGEFIIEYPEGNILTNFPDSLPMVVTIDNVPLGEYTMEVIGSGPNGTPVHTRDATIVHSELPLPVVIFTASDTAICTGGTVNFTDESQNSPIQWFWTFEGGNPASSTQQNPIGVTYNSPGSYNVTLYVVNASGFTELTKTDYISVGPNVALSPLNNICDNGSEVELTGGTPAGGNYFGTGVEAGFFNPQTTGIGSYSIGYAYTDENQCSDTAYQNVTVVGHPMPDLGVDSTICADHTYTLDATVPDAASYLWIPGNETTASIVVDSAGIGLNSQQFSVTVTSTDGCLGTDEVTLTFEECAGINEIKGLQSFSVYPNPNDGEFTLELESSVPMTLNYSILDSEGKLLLKEDGIRFAKNLNKIIAIRDVKKGVFYLVINIDGQEATQKILVK